MTDDDLPIFDARSGADGPDGHDAPDAPCPDVVGVVLAGGTSSRFGEANKLLAKLDGEPLVRRAVRTLTDADLDEVVVVLGHEADAVEDALVGFDVRTVRNPDYAAGLSTTVRRGVRAVGGADAAVFLPGDLPDVDAETVRRLVGAYRAGVASALAAAYDGRRGNPVLFDRVYFDALCRLDGDVGGRSVLLESDDAALVETGDAGVVRDVDTRADVRRRGGDPVGDAGESGVGGTDDGGGGDAE